MSRENVEVVRRVLGEISDRLDVSPEHFDPDFVMDMSEIADIGIQRAFRPRERYSGRSRRPSTTSAPTS